MLVKAKIISAEMRTHKDKAVCDLAVMVSDPSDVFVSTLWNNSVSKEEHKPFAAVVGQEVWLAIRPEVFNGKLKYQVVTSVLPQIVKPAPVRQAG